MRWNSPEPSEAVAGAGQPGQRLHARARRGDGGHGGRRWLYVVMFGSPLHKAAAAPKLSDAQQAYVQSRSPPSRPPATSKSVATQQAADYLRAFATQQAEATAAAGAPVAHAPAAPVKPAPPTASAPVARAAASHRRLRRPSRKSPTPTVCTAPSSSRKLHQSSEASPSSTPQSLSTRVFAPTGSSRTGWVLQYDCGGPDYPVPHAGCALAEQ